jgi:hypothetical protein
MGPSSTFFVFIFIDTHVYIWFHQSTTICEHRSSSSNIVLILSFSFHKDPSTSFFFFLFFACRYVKGFNRVVVNERKEEEKRKERKCFSTLLTKVHIYAREERWKQQHEATPLIRHVLYNLYIYYFVYEVNFHTG